VTINSQRDVCGVQKAGGIAISAAQLLRCMRIAATQAVKLTDKLREVVRNHEAARLASRVRRHRHGDSAQILPSSFVLGAKLPGEQSAAAAAAAGAAGGQADAMEASAPAYLAADSDGDDVSDADAGWDMVEPAHGSFPFSGPLRPTAASEHEVMAEQEPAKAAGVVTKPRNMVRFVGVGRAAAPRPRSAGVSCADARVRPSRTQSSAAAPDAQEPTSLLAAVKQPRRR
jgi:hypothetical protein